MQDNKIRDVSQGNHPEKHLLYINILILIFCALRMCATCALLVFYTLKFSTFQHNSQLLKPL